MRFLSNILLAVFAASFVAQAVTAQEKSNNLVGSKTDWSVFVEDNPTECWSVTIPKETVNTRDGRVVAATRGDILLMVFYQPSSNVKAQVTFTGGYPFRKDSTVNVNISGKEFKFFTEGEWAWPASPAEDAKIVTAMKRGASAIVTGISSRGTTTEDKFSLLGFTAAVEDAEKRCGS